MSEKDFTLSIETAVQGGSLSLLLGVTELDGWIGTREVSRSEDILEEIKNILERNCLEKKQIKRIVVSRGPGSYTGVRIGMAVGIGLRKALDCELIGVSVLEAMFSASKSASKKEIVGGEEEIITAVPIGRNQMCWQNFTPHNKSPNQNKSPEQKINNNENHPQLSTIEGFLDSANNNAFQFKKIILHRKLYPNFREKYGSRLTEKNILIDAGENIARLNGISESAQGGETIVLSPIYAMESVFTKSQK